MREYRKKIIRVSRGDRYETGQTAILTVILFTLIMTVLVVSFTGIVTAAQRATTNDELSASALAAAQSGIEDAKRILTFCANNPTNSDCAKLSQRLNQLDCSEITATLYNSVGITSANMENGAVRVGDQTGNQEFYTCLQIAGLTADFVGTGSPDGSSVIVPLNFVKENGKTDPNGAVVTFSWSSMSADAGLSGIDVPSGNNFPTVAQWKGNGKNYPAVVRLELVATPIDGSTFTVDELSRANTPNGGGVLNGSAGQVGDYAITLRPSTANNAPQPTKDLQGKIWGISLVDFATATVPNNATNTPLAVVDCPDNGGKATGSKDINDASGSLTGYACSVSFGLANNTLLMSEKYEYYLRVQFIYNTASFSVTGRDQTGEKLYFNNVQPTVDVTGRANDVFRRVQSRLSPVGSISDGSTLWYPDYALESGSQVCKDMSVTTAQDDNISTDNCQY